MEPAAIRDTESTEKLHPYEVRAVDKMTNKWGFYRRYEFKTADGTDFDLYFECYPSSEPFIYVEHTGDDNFKDPMDEGAMETILEILSGFWQRRHQSLGRKMPTETIDKMKGFKFISPGGPDPENTPRFHLYETFVKRTFPYSCLWADGKKIWLTPEP